jgi:hypothetical protein
MNDTELYSIEVSKLRSDTVTYMLRPGGQIIKEKMAANLIEKHGMEYA